MRPRRKQTKKILMCAQCGNPFTQYRAWQKFCSSKCKWKNWSQKHPRLPSPGTDGHYRFPRLPKRKLI
jgi:protein-arginine kinase activator protein McsA